MKKRDLLELLAARPTKLVDAEGHEVFVNDVSLRSEYCEYHPYWQRRHDTAYANPYRVTRATIGTLLKGWFWESEIAFEVYDDDA